MPHVMPKWYRDRPNATDQKTLENRDDHADLERREFIREAAIMLYACGKDEDGDPFSSVASWNLAKHLWDAKPEDA